MSNDLAVKTSQLTNSIKQMSDYLKGKIDNNATQLNENAKAINFSGCYIERTLTKLYSKQDVQIEFVGDSVTCGAGTTNTNKFMGGYVARFANWIVTNFPSATVKYIYPKTYTVQSNVTEYTTETLNDGGTESQVITIINGGLYGDTTFNMMNRSNEWIKFNNKSSDCYFFMAGCNDSNLESDTTRHVSAEDFGRMIEGFYNFVYDMTSGKADVVLQTPHWKDSTTAGQLILSYANKVREVGTKNNLLVIDHSMLWYLKYTPTASNGGLGDMINTDKLHPTDKGHEFIKNTIVNHLFDKVGVKVPTKVIIPASTLTNITNATKFLDYTISDTKSEATYQYKRCTETNGSFTVSLYGNELYAIVRDGKDSASFENNSASYDNTVITLGNMTTPVNVTDTSGVNPDLYSHHHKRVQLYKGDTAIACRTTIKHVSGNVDIYGFECVVY